MNVKNKFLIIAIGALLLTGSVAQAQIPTDFFYFREAVPAAPSAAANADGGGANCVAGVHAFAVTINVPNNTTGTQPYAETSLGNAATATCDGTHTKVDLTAIPVGSQYATQRNVYATKAGGTTLYYVATINDNTTTTYSFNTADTALTILYPQTGWRGAMPQKPIFSFVNNEVKPAGDNIVTFGDASNRFGLGGAVVPTRGLDFKNATSGTVNLAAPTGALGTPSLLLPINSGAIPTAFDCGSTGTGNQTCSPAAATGNYHMYDGQSTLSSNTATITFPVAFTSTTSFFCVANDVTTRANPVQMVPASASTATITNTTGGSDVIQWWCGGR